MLCGITLMCAWSSVCFDTTRGLLCSAVAPLLAQGFLSTQNRLNKLLLRKVSLTGREQRAGRTCMYCQVWQGAWFALDVENWSEEGTIKRVGLLLLLRRTRDLVSYVRAKPVFHIVWEVASLSLLHLICHLRSWAGPQEEYLPFEMDELCAVVLHVLLLSLLPGSYPWYLLFTLWEVICPQVVAISGCHPVPPGRLLSWQEELFSPCTLFLSVLAAFCCTFADSSLSDEHHHKAVQSYQTLLCATVFLCHLR